MFKVLFDDVPLTIYLIILVLPVQHHITAEFINLVHCNIIHSLELRDPKMFQHDNGSVHKAMCMKTHWFTKVSMNRSLSSTTVNTFGMNWNANCVKLYS